MSEDDAVQIVRDVPDLLVAKARIEKLAHCAAERTARIAVLERRCDEKDQRIEELERALLMAIQDLELFGPQTVVGQEDDPVIEAVINDLRAVLEKKS
jgi:predicted RNase H-like nuclease (RuvC/YqgF family)